MSATQPIPQFISPKELAERLGVKTKTLTAWRYRGRGPKFIKFGETVRYPLADVEAWLASCEEISAGG